MNSVKRSTLMTEGPIARQLITFALPLMVGMLFQQLYNTADSLIVGNFLGSEALAAVSSSSNLIMLLVGFFNGLSMGAGVVIEKAFQRGGDDLRAEGLRVEALARVKCMRKDYIEFC